MLTDNFLCFSISPVGEVPSTPPAEPMYKFHTSLAGEMFYFAVTRYVSNYLFPASIGIFKNVFIAT